jgi:hypothetical protein
MQYRKFFLFIFLLLSSISFAQNKMVVTAPNGQTFTLSGTDKFRGNDEMVVYTLAYYKQKPPSEAGIDVYVVEGKIVQIQDRAGAVFLQGKQDPGPISVGVSGYVLSGHGAARRWILLNLKIGDAVNIPGQASASSSNTSSDPFVYPGFGMVVAANGKTYFLNGMDKPRSENSLIYYTTDFYAKNPPNNAGVDLYVVGGKVSAINDRAKAVFIDKKEDPGAIKVGKEGFVLSANSEARKWVIANVNVGDAIQVTGITNDEVAPMASMPCFAGAYYRKAVSSFDSWTGIAGFVKLGTPKTDPNRIDEKDKQPLDNFSVYMGGNAGGRYEVDAGLTWEFTVDENGKRSEMRNAWRPFWRTTSWSSAPAKKEFYWYPGETVQMAVIAVGPKKLRLIVADALQQPKKMFQVDFDAEGFMAGVPRQFKRVNAIDQRGNEGKPVQSTKAEITGAEWLQTILLRGSGADAKQLPMNAARFTDMRCNAANVIVTTTDANKGAEKIDIFGTPKNH